MFANKASISPEPEQTGTPLGRALGLLAESPEGEDQFQVGLVVETGKGADKRIVQLNGRVTADQIRRLALNCQQRRQAALLRSMPAGSDRPETRKTPPRPAVVRKGRLPGEQKYKAPPKAGLNKKFGMAYRVFFRMIAMVGDGFSWFLRNMAGKKLMGPSVLGLSFVLFLLVLPLWYLLTVWYARCQYPDMRLLAGPMWLGRLTIPPLVFFAGLVSFFGGIRLIREQSYKSLLRPHFDPPPGLLDGPVFHFGKVTKLLQDCYENFIVFGAIGSGKTTAAIAPFLLQLLRKLNNPDHQASDARWGGLLLDVKGSFTDLLIYLMLACGRPLEDLILIDPDLDLYRYNPLDPSEGRFAERAADKLATVQKIMGNESKGENVYWNETSKTTVKAMLKVLTITRPPERIGIDDVWRFTRDDDRVAGLIKESRVALEKKRRNNQVTDDGYLEYVDAVSELETNWHKLDPRTKGILKTTITQLTGPLASDPRLQKVFCRDTNFTMKDVINRGKIVVLRARSLERNCARMLAVCLKLDFQEWTKRRTGSTAVQFGLNAIRTMVMLIDEYQEVVSCGGAGDETYCALARESRVIVFVTTQVRSSLMVAIGKEDELKTLLGSLTTKIFLKLSDKDTQELGSFYSGEIEKEQVDGTITHGSIVSALAGNVSSGGRDHSSKVTKKWEKVFRPDDFGRLQTIAKNKSLKGPWYSEAIIYNYSETDRDKKTWTEKTSLHHLYPDRKEMTRVSLLFDDLLFARNSQARSQRQLYYLMAAGEAEFARQQTLAAGRRTALQADLKRRALNAADSAGAVSGPRTRREQFELYKLDDNSLTSELEAKEGQLKLLKEKVGTSSSKYRDMLAERDRVATELAAVRLQQAVSGQSWGVTSGSLIAQALSANRSVSEVLKQAKDDGHSIETMLGPKKALHDLGPTAGMKLSGTTANPTQIQDSAMPGHQSGPTPPPTPAPPPATEPPANPAADPLPLAPAGDQNVGPTKESEPTAAPPDECRVLLRIIDDAARSMTNKAVPLSQWKYAANTLNEAAHNYAREEYPSPFTDPAPTAPTGFTTPPGPTPPTIPPAVPGSTASGSGALRLGTDGLSELIIGEMPDDLFK
jgi:hypothetical protein